MSREEDRQKIINVLEMLSQEHDEFMEMADLPKGSIVVDEALAALDRLAAPPSKDVRELASMLPRKAVYIPIPHGVWNSAAAENMLESFRARILDEAAERVIAEAVGLCLISDTEDDEDAKALRSAALGKV